MKKFTLFAMALSSAIVTFGQNTTPQVKPEFYKGPTVVPQTLTGVEAMPAPTQIIHSNSQIGQPQTIRQFTETIIGNTFYDLQTNSAISDRLVYNSTTGTISAVWTFSPDATPNWPIRGTGYSFFDGTAWSAPPSDPIEAQRTGFPNIAIPSNGSENVFAHNTASGVMQQTSRPTTGSGTWTDNLTALANDAVLGNLWSKTAVNGNNIHLISLTCPVANGGALYNGLDGFPMYYRSTDGGVSWDKTNVGLPDINAENFVAFSGDSYQIDANGNTVAIVVGGGIYNDVLLYKSTDNGDTWTKTIVYEHPYFKFTDDTITDIDGDEIADSIQISDGAFSILIDNEDMVHLWWGDMFIVNDNADDDAYSYYFTNSLMHWSETIPGGAVPIENLTALDLDGSGVLEFPDDGAGGIAIGTFSFKGLVSYPNAGIDANGNIFLSYMAAVENSQDAVGQAIRHIYVSASTDNGESWSDPIDVVSDEFAEGAYACVARNVNDKLRLIYQRDFCAGISTSTFDPCNSGTENEIVYVEMPVLDLGINVGVPAINNVAGAISIFPNPSTGFMTLDFKKSGQTEVAVSVTNSIGQVVKTINALKVSNNKAALDLSGMEDGVYYVNIKSETLNSTLPVNLLNN